MGRTPGELLQSSTGRELTEMFVYDHLEAYERHFKETEVTPEQQMQTVLGLFGMKGPANAKS